MTSTARVLSRGRPTELGDAVFFDCQAPHQSGPDLTGKPRRVPYVTYNRASAGDHRRQCYADKRARSPDVERDTTPATCSASSGSRR